MAVKPGVISKDGLMPSQFIYSDQSEGQQKFCQPILELVRGQNTLEIPFFMMSLWLCVGLQVWYTETEMIKSKLQFKQMALEDISVQVHYYHTDNGI